MASLPEVPKIISVDDHVVEPPDLWTNRLPAKYQDRAPRIVREKCTMKMVGGVFTFERNVPDGDWCDVWLYDDLVYPFPKLSAASRFRQPRQRAGHVRPDPPRRLEAEGTTRRHGRQPRPGVDQLPQRVAAVLRASLPRAPGQRARAVVRAGLQRLDDRRMVRRCRATVA